MRWCSLHLPRGRPRAFEIDLLHTPEESRDPETTLNSGYVLVTQRAISSPIAPLHICRHQLRVGCAFAFSWCLMDVALDLSLRVEPKYPPRAHQNCRSAMSQHRGSHLLPRCNMQCPCRNISGNEPQPETGRERDRFHRRPLRRSNSVQTEVIGFRNVMNLKVL